MIGGSKNVIKDGSGFYQTLDKRAFIAGGYRTPTGGNVINMQLWNPAASGKLLICEWVWVFQSNANPAGSNFRHHNAALADGNLDYGNKQVGEAVGVGVPKYQSGAALGTAIARYWDQGTTLNGKGKNFIFGQGIIVPQGMGFNYAPEAADVSVAMMWEWYEIDA